MNECDVYRKQIRHAFRELIRWQETKRRADQEMSKLRALIVANANMLPESERRIFIQQANESFPGFTDTIRDLFRAAYPKGLTPKQLREKLVEVGFDLDGQANPMASIHSVLRRLCLRDEIEEHGDVEIGGFRWKPSEGYIPPPPGSSDPIEDTLKALTKGKR